MQVIRVEHDCTGRQLASVKVADTWHQPDFVNGPSGKPHLGETGNHKRIDPFELASAFGIIHEPEAKECLEFYPAKLRIAPEEERVSVETGKRPHQTPV